MPPAARPASAWLRGRSHRCGWPCNWIAMGQWAKEVGTRLCSQASQNKGLMFQKRVPSAIAHEERRPCPPMWADPNAKITHSKVSPKPPLQQAWAFRAGKRWAAVQCQAFPWHAQQVLQMQKLGKLAQNSNFAPQRPPTPPPATGHRWPAGKRALL